MHIDFVSDVACPWCAVGLNALERALERLGDEIPVELRFQPYELNPDLGPGGRDIVEYLAEKYGMSPAQVEAAQTAIHARGDAVGFTFGHRERTWNTFDAHRLLHWAGLQGADEQRALKHALLTAYHGHGRNPSDPEVLVGCAVEVGLDGDDAYAVVASGQYSDEVRAAEQHWLGLGIRAVPSIVIDGRHLIQGGQPPEVFEQALRELAAQSPESSES